MWRDIMEQIHEGLPTREFEVNDNIEEVEVCSQSGKLPIPGLCDKDPRGSQLTKEYFSKDTVPTEYCDTHIKVTICNDTGKIARTGCTNTSTKILIKKSAINIPADIENPEDEKEYTTWDQDYSITQEELDSPCTKHSGTSTYKATSSVINSGTSGSTSTRPSGTGSTTTPATLPSGSTGTTSGNGTTSNGTTSNGTTGTGTTGSSTTGTTSSSGTTTNRR